MYYLADPLAEMPPFILVDEKSKYEDVIGWKWLMIL